MYFPTLPTSSFPQLTSFNYQNILEKLSEQSKKIKFNIYPAIPVISLVALNIGATLIHSNLAKWTIRILAPTLGVIIIYRQLEKSKDPMDSMRAENTSQEIETPLDKEEIIAEATFDVIVPGQAIEEEPSFQAQSPIAKDGSESGPQQQSFSIERVQALIRARSLQLSPNTEKNQRRKQHPFSPSKVSGLIKNRSSNQNQPQVKRQLNFEKKPPVSPSKVSEMIKNRKKNQS